MNGVIYIVTNIINDRQYVGQSIVSGNKVGHGKLLTRAYEKYGKENFSYDLLSSDIQEKSLLNYLERFWICTMGSRIPNGYNIEHGGSDKDKVSQETREKQRQNNLGKKLSEETKKKIRSHRHTEEQKMKIQKSRLGKKLSEETIEKIRKGNQGKKVLQETKDKLSALNKGKTLSVETKKKLLEAAKLQWIRQKGNE